MVTLYYQTSAMVKFWLWSPASGVSDAVTVNPFL